jgi:hypothetical protein
MMRIRFVALPIVVAASVARLAAAAGAQDSSAIVNSNNGVVVTTSAPASDVGRRDHRLSRAGRARIRIIERACQIAQPRGAGRMARDGSDSEVSAP